MSSGDDVMTALQRVLDQAREKAATMEKDPDLLARMQEREKQRQAEEHAAWLASQAESFKRRGIPPGLSRFFGVMDMTLPVVERVKRFIAPGSGELLLFLGGAVGTGKSLSAAWAAAFNGGHFAHAFRLIQAGTYDREFWEFVREPQLLVLDDMGAEPQDSKGHGLANVANLLAERHAALKQTIVTTNLPKDAFMAAYCQGPGLRIRDRVREGGVWFNVAGESMRGRG